MADTLTTQQLAAATNQPKVDKIPGYTTTAKPTADQLLNAHYSDPNVS